MVVSGRVIHMIFRPCSIWEDRFQRKVHKGSKEEMFIRLRRIFAELRICYPSEFNHVHQLACWRNVLYASTLA